MSDNGTILGPLTRTWTYPSRCNLLFLADCPTCTIAVQAQKCNTASSITVESFEDLLCWPPATKSKAFKPPISFGGIYKPASECPQGYTVACTAEGTTKSDFEFQYEANEDEFIRGCCPSLGTDDNAVATNVPNMEAHKRVRVSIQQLAGSEPFEISSTSDSESVFLTSSTTNLSSTSAETSTSSVEPDSRGGLSTGAQAGIGVGVGVVGFGILGAAFYLWRRRRRSKVPSKSMLESSQLDSREVKPPGELGGTPLAPSQYAAAELDGTPVRQELP
ncbi:hypothetical protein FGSG_03815 [Fusarium graminearum PH-1]|uniref:hypothetical protein n=1 Tax=Gibberella zeae (strain ATCC MYA-4620 / CBS 123657 / FGSC 9075 / NRRL 31084 / PH-1) TaxID=229533 RepID=UPI000023D663|nr:hypothetical protein FGSG_03815 [Fusarium graminearum PH-1]ESU09371.1 hypothetical protein FGSG_03815 [Fusarium graminearum PH-1]|eukprot:XP_011321870.1 hypothetical protein FGSG_03815 [Fusarium graminearum PH-1]